MYGMPKGIERGREAIDIIMGTRKLSEKDISKKVNEIKGKIEKLL